MDNGDLLEFKMKYLSYKHHAWAGLGFLSIALAIRLFIPLRPPFDLLFLAIVTVLILYIIGGLVLTYKYRKGLMAKENITPAEPLLEFEKKKLQAKLEKKRLKVEKKKWKAEAETRKGKSK